MALDLDENPAPSKPVEQWLRKVTDALKREKTYRQDGGKIVDLWEGKKDKTQPFAILYSNTETLAPSVYNSRPIPVVDRRFKDADPLGLACAETATRTLKFLIEEEPLDFDPFDELMQSAVIDGLVTNRGLTRFRYHANASAGGYAGECVYGEGVRWDKFFHGYARTWKKVPFIGFEHDMTPEEFRKEFKVKGRINYENPANTTREDRDGGETREQLTGVKIVKVYEVWNKADRKVLFFSPNWKEAMLRELDDPLELKGFYPVPRPLNFQRKITTLVPTPLYVHYEQQAKELNELTNRLKAIIKACKIRGFYDNTIEGIEKVLTAEDNELVPVENRSSMPEGMAMDKMLWLMPLGELVQAAQTLYEQRQQCKQIIYEITGISDILRGASVASETATAQQIKNQWGTLRLKKLQKEVQRYCKDCLKIMLEIAATKFDITTFRAMTNLQYPTAQEKAQVQAQLEAMELQAQQAAEQAPLMAQQAGQSPQDSPPAEPPAELLEIMQKPSWEDIQGLLQNDLLRDYRVEIETNSTIDAEASQDKQDIGDLLNAISQFLNGIAPLVEQGVMDIEVAKQMLLTVCRRYTFGPQLEEALLKMKAPEPAADPKAEAEAAKLQAEMEKMKLEMEGYKVHNQLETQILQQKASAEQAGQQLDAQKAQLELQVEQARIGMEMQKAQMEMQIASQEHAQKMELMQLQMQVEREKIAGEQAKLVLEKISLENKAEFEKTRHKSKMNQVKEKGDA